MIPPFAPLFNMDGIAFQAMAKTCRSIIQNSTVSTQVTQQIRHVEVFSRYSKSLMVSHYEPISTAIPMVGGQIQLLVISQL